VYIYGTLLNYFKNEKKYLRQKLQTKSKHTLYAQKLVSENPAFCEMTWKNMVEPDRSQ
jgi:gamma-glutamylcyclotransferase (GGCT)/AIG2-like uncharacterized protein YtfP